MQVSGVDMERVIIVEGWKQEQMFGLSTSSVKRKITIDWLHLFGIVIPSNATYLNETQSTSFGP